MGQQVSCPCSTGDNVDFDSVDSDSAAAVNARKNNSAAVYVSTNPPTVDPASTNPFDEREEDDKVTPIGIKVKSRRWKARTEDAADFSSNSAQVGCVCMFRPGTGFVPFGVLRPGVYKPLVKMQAQEK